MVALDEILLSRLSIIASFICFSVSSRYYLTDNVILCDCPGLVFPSQIDRPLQILAGMYPVAQVQEPYTVVG